MNGKQIESLDMDNEQYALDLLEEWYVRFSDTNIGKEIYQYIQAREVSPYGVMPMHRLQPIKNEKNTNPQNKA